MEYNSTAVQHCMYVLKEVLAFPCMSGHEKKLHPAPAYS